MLVVRCKECNKEIVSHPSKMQCCGCSNMMTLRNDTISAVDLSKVIMVNSMEKEKKTLLTNQDIAWQEERKKRKVRKLDFEIR